MFIVILTKDLQGFERANYIPMPGNIELKENKPSWML